MPPNKVVSSAAEAIADIPDGAVIMVAGYGPPGTPQRLVEALLEKGVRELSCICGPLYGRDPGLYDAAKLAAEGRVKRLVTSPPTHSDSLDPLMRMWKGHEMDMEMVEEGTLVERIRAAGAGLGGVFLPVRVAGPLTRLIDGRRYVLEEPIRADFALLRAHQADTLGNLVYHRSQRNWNPIMAASADVTIAEVDEVVEPGKLDSELIVTPGIYVDRLLAVGGGSRG